MTGEERKAYNRAYYLKKSATTEGRAYFSQYRKTLRSTEEGRERLRKYLATHRAKIASDPILYWRARYIRFSAASRAHGAQVVTSSEVAVYGRVETMGSTCQSCGASHDLHMGHKKPASRGGPAMLSNVVLLCKKCNLAQNDAPFQEFMIQRKAYAEAILKKASEGSIPLP